MIQLQIDPTPYPDCELILQERGKIKARRRFTAPRNLGPQLLRELEQLLTEQQLDLTDLTALTVKAGPSPSFTSLRVAVAIANALALALQIPVNNLPRGQYVQPNYGKKPHLTAAKKHLNS